LAPLAKLLTTKDVDGAGEPAAADDDINEKAGFDELTDIHARARFGRRAPRIEGPENSGSRRLDHLINGDLP
jgi:hypothetical protein